MEIKEIIEKYNNGEVERETDEKYAGGFWDYAGDFIGSYRNQIMGEAKTEELQEDIYSSLLEVFEVVSE